MVIVLGEVERKKKKELKIRGILEKKKKFKGKGVEFLEDNTNVLLFTVFNIYYSLYCFFG